MMLTYQKTAQTGYPFENKKNRVPLGAVQAVIMAWNFVIVINQVGKGWWVVAAYSFFELIWDGLMISPYWARRKVILYQVYIQYYYGQNETLFEKGEILKFVIHYLIKVYFILVFVFI